MFVEKRERWLRFYAAVRERCGWRRIVDVEAATGGTIGSIGQWDKPITNNRPHYPKAEIMDLIAKASGVFRSGNELIYWLNTGKLILKTTDASPDTVASDVLEQETASAA